MQQYEFRVFVDGLLAEVVDENTRSRLLDMRSEHGWNNLCPSLEREMKLALGETFSPVCTHIQAVNALLDQFISLLPADYRQTANLKLTKAKRRRRSVKEVLAQAGVSGYVVTIAEC